MLTVQDVVEKYRSKITQLGYGRRALAEWLNDNLQGRYTEHFARKVLDSLGEHEISDHGERRERSMEEILRETYGLYDPTWIPVSVWGDPRNPRAKWERRLDLLDAERMTDIIESLGTEELPSVSLPDSDDQRMGIVSVRDTHFGMFTDHPGPYKTYDLDEAQASYRSAAFQLMRNAEMMGVSHLVIPFGSDALHVDGPQSTTTRGTPQEVSTAWTRAFEAALTSLNDIVVEAMGRFEKVTLALEPGNHDHSLAQALGIAVKAQWSGQVEVLAGNDTLKRVSIGDCYVFLHHGDSMKPQAYHGVIYSDYPECARKEAYIEVLSGHLHHRRRTVLLESGDYLEEAGIVHRITPALCPATNWTESMGYRSDPGAQLTVYDKNGFLALFEWTPRLQSETTPA